MIGPPSTFYNPEDVSQQLRDSHTQQYQQWIEMFDNQLRGTTTAYGALQQQQQHPHHHHRGYHPAPQTQFNFVAGQYTPPHSLSAYAESASGDTVTQSNVGAPSDNSERIGEGYQPYYDLLAATVGTSSSSVSPQSYNPRARSESTLHSYAGTPSSAYQEPTHSHAHSLQTNPQQRSSAHTQSQQQTQPQRPTQPTQPAHSHARQQHLSPHHQAYSSGSNTLSTHSASLSPASVSWTDDASYPNAHPSPPTVNGRGKYAQPQPQPQHRQNGALNGALGRSAHPKKTVGTAELSPGGSPPGTAGINGVNGTSSHSHQPPKQTHSHHLLVGPPPPPPPPQPPKANGTGTKTGSKRKRVKRNSGEGSSSPPQNEHRPQNPQQSHQQNGNGSGQLKIVPWTEFAGEPGSDSDSDDSDDVGFFDGGGIGVGLGGLGVVSKGVKRGRGFGGRSRL
jgi:hypothetical protein